MTMVKAHAILSALLLTLGKVPDKEQVAQEPVPTAAAQAEARALILDLFRAEYAKKDDPEARDALIAKLLEQARETTDDAAARFVLFVEAKNLALLARNIETSLGAVDELGKHFFVDAVGIKEEALEIIGGNVRTSDERRAVATAQLVLIPQAVRKDQYDLAKRLANAAAAHARAGRDISLMNEARRQGREVDDLRAAYSGVKKARDRLVSSPNDSAANLTVGRFRCLVKGDWETGLPFLLKGSDAKLRAQAARDLQNPLDTSKQMDVGDGWWELGEADEGVSKNNLRRRAAYWYEKALPTLAGISKLKVEKRIAQLAKPAFEAPGGPPTISREGLLGRWTFDQGRGNAPADESGNNRTASFVNNVRWAKGKLGKAVLLSGVGDYVAVPHAADMNPLPLTVTLWLRTRRADKNQTVICKYSYYNGYQIYTTKGTVAVSYHRDRANRVTGLTAPPGPGTIVVDGKWHHLAYVLDLNEGKLYIDGKLKARKPWTGSPGSSTTRNDFRIGKFHGTGIESFQGIMDDVRLYARALSGAEIKILADGGQ